MTTRRRPLRPRRAERDEEGAVAVVFAIVAVSLFVLAGLIVDLGLARDVRGQAQSAADSSALAAGAALYAGGASTPQFASAVSAATSYAEQNFQTTAAQWSSCTDPDRPASYHVPSGSTPCVSFDSATSPTQVRVVLPKRTVPMGLGQLAGVRSIPVGAVAQSAVSRGGTAPCGLCVLESTSNSGTPDVRVSNAGIHLNGTPSFSGNTSITVTGGAFTVENTPNKSGRPTLSPNPTVTGRMSDPLASLTLPFDLTGLSDQGNKSFSGSGSCTLSPGRYGSISLSGTRSCTMAAGLYVFAGSSGGLRMSGSSSLNATSGVTLYFTCGTSAAPRECGTNPTNVYETGAGLDVSGTNDFDITAPATGQSKGLAIVYDRKNNNNLDYSGTNQDRLFGTVYAAYSTFNLSGTADSTNTDSMIVVRDLRLSGNGTIAITYTAANNVPMTSTSTALTK